MISDATKKQRLKKWLDALRSGDYVQGKFRLAQRPNKGADWQWCCLGVLCDVAGLYDEGGGGSLATFDGQRALPPLKVAEWLGLTPIKAINGAKHGAVKLRLASGHRTLDQLNDEGRSHAEIADLIEKHGVEAIIA